MLGQALRRTHEISGTQESHEGRDPACEVVATCRRLITAFKQVGADLDELLRRVQ